MYLSILSVYEVTSVCTSGCACLFDHMHVQSAFDMWRLLSCACDLIMQGYPRSVHKCPESVLGYYLCFFPISIKLLKIIKMHNIGLSVTFALDGTAFSI